MTDDRHEAFAAIAEFDRVILKARHLPAKKALKQVQAAFDKLAELKRTQPFEWTSPALARRWFTAITYRVDRVPLLIEKLTKETEQ